MRALLIAAALTVSASLPASAQSPAAAPPQPAASADDPYVWLEDMRGERAMTWVREQNARSLARLERDPRYQRFYDQALAIVQATDRIPSPIFRRQHIDNFWRDEQHQQGLWRRTTMDSYRTATPRWETILDLDALSRAENTNWVWGGADCLRPDETRCLVSISRGGQDADVIREFDTGARRFVEGGFNLPESKQSAAWLDADTLILTRDWGPGTMTTSGYGFVVKRLDRGQPLAQAQEAFRGRPSDVGVFPVVLRDADGRVHGSGVIRAVSFFESEFHLFGRDGRPVRIPLPAKASYQGFLDGQMLFTLEEAWTPRAGQTFAQGALVSIDLAQFQRNPGNVQATLVYAPGPRESIEQVATTRNRLIVAAYENVKGAVYSYRRQGNRWTRQRLPLPQNSGIGVAAASDDSDELFVNVTNFTAPTTLWLANAATARAEQVKSLPARFNAENLVTEQFEATSSDGTRVPYFVVRRRDIPYDGSNPTLMYGYGGFQASQTPGYRATMGKLWLENGGVFVLTNIRGGGEFGPAWHQAGLKTNRQIIYDDFAAIARDLIARRITSPRRLGIMGGSNGGLLTGVSMVQQPDLWNAVVVQVPLLDMLRFEQIGAGASWVGEYGSVSNPQERAFLQRISPYHNVRAGVRYPEPFLVTNTNDDRVHPAHARKMAARMAELGLPYLFYEETEGGHSGDANLRQVARDAALTYVYLAQKLMD